MHEIRLESMVRRHGTLVFSYTGAEYVEAWIENANKHYPHVLAFDAEVGGREIGVAQQKLSKFLETYAGHRFRLCVCNSAARYSYSLSDALCSALVGDPVINIESDTVLFASAGLRGEACIEYQAPCCNIEHRNKAKFDSQRGQPMSVLDIGSCFSRSIFKSDNYFNPNYKAYFHVAATLFHNSYISLFSDPIPLDVTGIEDLQSGDAGKYVGVEFSKDLDRAICGANTSLVVTDLYVEAAVPVVRMSENVYLTYNKYISESIFKRKLSSLEIIYPGSKEHGDLLKRSLASFRQWLDACHIRDLVLVGGRLSRYKIDETTNREDVWTNKSCWIEEVNRNWDIADELFLHELPNTIYLDKRSTSWKSDIHSPILGGASPSHYQSGYYKELYQDLISLI